MHAKSCFDDLFGLGQGIPRALMWSAVRTFRDDRLFKPSTAMMIETTKTPMPRLVGGCSSGDTKLKKSDFEVGSSNITTAIAEKKRFLATLAVLLDLGPGNMLVYRIESDVAHSAEARKRQDWYCDTALGLPRIANEPRMVARYRSGTPRLGTLVKSQFSNLGPGPRHELPSINDLDFAHSRSDEITTVDFLWTQRSYVSTT
ncbi:hypothetical protein EJ07DRAFT_159386 [Lizonia empirigonia]|nr:hypothetical protein EJ07DRAFT_159386 [Lizonia empirigonia]